jgi:hypothetical protein
LRTTYPTRTPLLDADLAAIYLPYAFETEHGVAMLSSVLRSRRAVIHKGRLWPTAETCAADSSRLFVGRRRRQRKLVITPDLSPRGHIAVT